MEMMVDVFASAIIAALAGMGVGGGGLLVLYLVFVKNMEQVEAQGINLVFFICAAVSAMFYHIRKRRIDLRLTAYLCVFGLVGAVAGAVTASVLEPDTVRRIFGWMLIISGGAVLFLRKK